MKGHGKHLVFLKHHEVEMPNSFCGVVTHTFLERWPVDDIANVLMDECVSEMCEGYR
jgi:hypothetical protein